MKLSLNEQSKKQVFKQLYEEYYAPFCLYAKRFVDNKETREDIVSEVFASLWNNMDNFEIDPKTILGYQEYEWNYAEVVKKKTPVYETEPDSVYTLDEMYRMLYGTLNKLPESYRIVFIESFFKGKTHTEIAEELNLSVKSVNRYKQKTLEFLRNELKEYMPLLLLFIPR